MEKRNREPDTATVLGGVGGKAPSAHRGEEGLLGTVNGTFRRHGGVDEAGRHRSWTVWTGVCIDASVKHRLASGGEGSDFRPWNTERGLATVEGVGWVDGET